MKNFTVYLNLLALAAMVIACSKEEPVQPPCSTPPEITHVEVIDTGCNEASGTVEVTATGGSGVLMYNINGGSFQAANTFSGLAAGSYTIEVKDEEGCLSSQEVAVGESGTLSVSIVSTTESGCGQTQGSVQLSATGGEEGYRFSLDGETFQEQGIFEGLAAKEYTGHVKDAAGCVETETFAIQSGISFEASVKSIIQTNCAISGCHVAGTGREDFTQFSEIQSNASTIKNYTQNGNMPPESSGKKLSNAEIEAIACWVDDGAPQN